MDVKSLQLSVALPDAAERPWQLQAVLGAEASDSSAESGSESRRKEEECGTELDCYW